MALGLLWDREHDPQPPATSQSKAVWTTLFWWFLPLQYSLLPSVFLVHCAYQQQVSALTPNSFFWVSWHFSWNTAADAMGACVGVWSAYCVELKRQRAVFSLSLATPQSAPPGMTLLRSFILFSESQAPAITSHWNQCQALKGSSNVQHLSRNSPIYMGKAPGSSGRLALSCACCKTNKHRFI